MGTKGRGVHIGVPAPAPLGQQTFANLPGTVRDAQDLAEITQSAGFSTVVVTGSDATVERVRDELLKACAAAGPDGTVVVTFSGHGWQVSSNDPDEPDRYDEIWMLADDFIADTTIGRILHGCAPGVTVVAILDSCRSRSGAFDAVPSVVDVPLADSNFERLDAPDIPGPVAGESRPAATVLTLSAVDHDEAPAFEDQSGGVFSTALADSWRELLEELDDSPTWAQLWSRTVGHVYAHPGMGEPQRPYATFRGARTGMLNEPAFTI